MEDKATLSIDTRGACFICFQSCGSSSHLISWRSLSRYLELDRCNVFTRRHGGVLNDLEVVVTLCSSRCHGVVEEFCGLYEDFEVIRRSMDECLRRVEELMVDANQNEKLAAEFYRRLGKRGLEKEEAGARFVENMRRETLRKCISRISPAVENLAKNPGEEEKRVKTCAVMRTESMAEDVDSLPVTGIQTTKVTETEVTTGPVTSSNVEEVTLDDSPPPPLSVEPNSSVNDTNSSNCKSTKKRPKAKKEDQDIPFMKLASGKYECLLCGKTVSKGDGITYHKLIHAGGTAFSCKLCKAGFRDKPAFVRHTIHRHRFDVFFEYKNPKVRDAVFEATVNTLYNANVLKDESVSEKQFSCALCLTRFKLKSNVEFHLTQVHVAELGFKLLRIGGNASPAVHSKGPVITAVGSVATGEVQLLSQSGLTVEQRFSSIPLQPSRTVVSGTVEIGPKNTFEINSQAGLQVPPPQASASHVNTTTLSQVRQSPNITATSKTDRVGPRPKGQIQFKYVLLSGKYECLDCGNAVSKRCKILHINQHLGNEPTTCHICTISFDRYDKYVRHIVSRHRFDIFSNCKHPCMPTVEFEGAVNAQFDNVAYSTSTSAGTLYECTICSNRFSTRIKAEFHACSVHVEEMGSLLKARINLLHPVYLKPVLNTNGERPLVPPLKDWNSGIVPMDEDDNLVDPLQVDASDIAAATNSEEPEIIELDEDNGDVIFGV